MPAAQTANVVPIVTIPPMTNTSVLLPSADRARSSSSAPVMAAKAMQPNLGAPMPRAAATVMMAPTAAEDENAASRLVNQVSARIALVAKQSWHPGSSAGGSSWRQPASTIETRPATPSRPRDISADIEPMVRNGAAVITPANAATATTNAKHDTAVNATTPHPVSAYRQHRRDCRSRRGQQHVGDTRSARNRHKAGNRGECGGDQAQREPGDRVPICPVRYRREQHGNRNRPLPPHPRWRQRNGWCWC